MIGHSASSARIGASICSPRHDSKYLDLELFLTQISSEWMLQRGPIFVGDLKPVGTARPLAVVGPDRGLPSWITISISCLSTLTLFTAAGAWLVPHGDWSSTTLSQRLAPAASVQPQPPSTFPTWVEVPHLTGPLSHANDPDTFNVADAPRTFLDPNPADAVEQPAFLPPRANPRLPLLGLAPLDAGRLTHEQPPAWNERPDRQDIAMERPSLVVATLKPDLPDLSQDPAEPRPTQPLSADPASTPILPPRSARARAPTEVIVRPAPTIPTVLPLGHVATLSPDHAQQVVDRTSPIVPPSETGIVVAPIQNPGPVKQARSLSRPRTATAASRARAPYRAAEQTASIISRPIWVRGRIDASAIAQASLHRTRANRPASSPTTAPSSPWTLPSALAPTD